MTERPVPGSGDSPETDGARPADSGDFEALGFSGAAPAMTRAEARAARESAAATDAGTRAETDGSAAATGAPKRAPKPRRRASVTGVIGEILLTLGAIALLFVGWQMWFSGWIGGASNNQAGRSLERQWEQAAASAAPSVSAAPSTAPSETATTPTGGQPAPGDPPVLAEARDGQTFGVMYVPRFGADYSVPMGGGVSRARTLDTIGIGHYPGTAMPGGVGNTAYAAHRTGYGGWPFYRIAELQPGDQIIIGTQDGWYTYVYRNFEYVTPAGTGVLDDVPQSTNAESGARYLTLTSCSPVHTTQERIIAYAMYESFTPRANGAPAAIASLVQANGG